MSISLGNSVFFLQILSSKYLRKSLEFILECANILYMDIGFLIECCAECQFIALEL